MLDMYISILTIFRDKRSKKVIIFWSHVIGERFEGGLVIKSENSPFFLILDISVIKQAFLNAPVIFFSMPQILFVIASIKSN